MSRTFGAVIIGDEILSGKRQDKHFAKIAEMLAVRGLLRFISQHDFTVFAWYRIVFGLVILVTAYTGVIAWSEV